MDLSSTTTENRKIFIGMGGWEIPSFNEFFYPSNPAKGFRKLKYYSQFFDLVEVNATFYNTSLSPAMAYRWLKDVEKNERFVFTVKLFRGFTHTFNATQKDVLAVNRLLQPLRETKKLVGLVVQFPSSYLKSDTNQERIEKIRNIFAEDTIFLDLRHNSWNSDSTLKFCKENNLNLINIDLPQLPNHMPLNANSFNEVAYFRMMGRNADDWNNFASNNRYNYSYSEQELIDLINKIKQANANKTYVVFHNDKIASSLANGYELNHKLNPLAKLCAPIGLLSRFPHLKEFCKPIENNHNAEIVYH